MGIIFQKFVLYFLSENLLLFLKSQIKIILEIIFYHLDEAVEVNKRVVMISV